MPSTTAYSQSARVVISVMYSVVHMVT